jgi:hypothetical protein
MSSGAQTKINSGDPNYTVKTEAHKEDLKFQFDPPMKDKHFFLRQTLDEKVGSHPKTLPMRSETDADNIIGL